MYKIRDIDGIVRAFSKRSDVPLYWDGSMEEVVRDTTEIIGFSFYQFHPIYGTRFTAVSSNGVEVAKIYEQSGKLLSKPDGSERDAKRILLNINGRFPNLTFKDTSLELYVQEGQEEFPSLYQGTLRRKVWYNPFSEKDMIVDRRLNRDLLVVFAEEDIPCVDNVVRPNFRRGPPRRGLGSKILFLPLASAVEE